MGAEFSGFSIAISLWSVPTRYCHTQGAVLPRLRSSYALLTASRIPAKETHRTPTLEGRAQKEWSHGTRQEDFLAGNFCS